MRDSLRRSRGARYGAAATLAAIALSAATPATAAELSADATSSSPLANTPPIAADQALQGDVNRLWAQLQALLHPHPAPGALPAPTAPANTETPERTVLLADAGEGPDDPEYISPATNKTHPTWYAEGGTSPVARQDDVIVVDDHKWNWRMWSQNPVGGPGQDIRFSARVRVTDIGHGAPGKVMEGAKMILKWPDSRDKDYPGPASVRGDYATDDIGPGQYTYSFSTRSWRTEISKRQPSTPTSQAYTFLADGKHDPLIGQWQDIAMTVEWLPEGVRIRAYRDGVLEHEATDTTKTRMMLPGFAGFRADDTALEIAAARVELLALSGAAPEAPPKDIVSTDPPPTDRSKVR